IRIFGRTLRVPTEPGEWTVTARVAGGSPSATATLRVEEQPPAVVELDCPEEVVAGEAFECDVEVRDAFGRVLAETPAWTLSPPAGTSIHGSTFELERVGTVFVNADVGDVGASRPVRVVPAAPHTIEVAVVPARIDAGEQVRIEVAIE